MDKFTEKLHRCIRLTVQSGVKKNIAAYSLENTVNLLVALSQMVCSSTSCYIGVNIVVVQCVPFI